MNEQKNNISWTLVVITLIFFWPVGAFLLWRKLSTDRTATMRSGKGITIIGWVLVVIGILGFIGLLEEGMYVIDFFVILIFCGAGAALIIIGNKTKKNAKRYRSYIAVVANQNEKEIRGIASILNLSPEVVKKDLTEMIEKGFFQDAYIDHRKGSIVFNSKTTTEKIKYRALQCQGCRAINKVAEAQVGRCEYCRSMIMG